MPPAHAKRLRPTVRGTVSSVAIATRLQICRSPIYGGTCLDAQEWVVSETLHLYQDRMMVRRCNLLRM